MTAFDDYLHAVIVRAEREARDDGSATIEARHLLLAVAGEPEATTQEVLASAGCDHQTIRDALDREFEHSLSTVGVSRAAFDLPKASNAIGRPTLGASAKLALERGVGTVARKKDLRPAHLLLGILKAEVGTVPRALALAGIDQNDLTARLSRTIEGGGAC
jgi:D-alanyl-D-alanine carboxypeptidase